MTQPRDDIRDDRPPGRALARLFATQLLAVVAITVVLTGIFVLVKGTDDATTTALDPPAATSPAGTPSATPAPATSTPAPSTPASTKPPSTTPPSTSGPPSTTASPSTTSPAANRPEVVVFNQDGPQGSGQDAAQRLRDQGWKVFKVDDFTGTVSTTTVYYPDGLEKQARRAAKDLPGDVRTKVKFSNLSETRLTLIITDDYGS